MSDKKPVGAPQENKNAEKWGEQESINLFNQAIEVANEKEHDFIGEVAKELNIYRDLFTYLKDKYSSCKELYKRLFQICESNCFSHGKKNKIVPSMAIMNLKSNHGWTDRVDNTNNNINTGDSRVTIDFED